MNILALYANVDAHVVGQTDAAGKDTTSFQISHHLQLTRKMLTDLYQIQQIIAVLETTTFMVKPILNPMLPKRAQA